MKLVLKKGKKPVHAVREHLGMSRKDFADEIGVHWMQLSKWERGLFKPYPYMEKAFEELCERLNIEIAER